MSKAKTSSVITKPASVIEESVQIRGHVNSFVSYFDKKQPELTAVGYVKIPDTNTYVSYVITIKGSEVVKVVCDEPNMKIVAEESAKVSFVNLFVDAGEE